MGIKAERRSYVECDGCNLVHPAREVNSYMARVKAGVDGWFAHRDLGKGASTFDYCPDCKEGPDVTFSRETTQGSDATGKGTEES